MLKKILVPVDGSTLSAKVLPYALKLAARLDLQVTLVRVVEETAILSKEELEKSKDAQVARDYLSGISDYLTTGRETPLIASSRLATKILYGDPAEEICRYASQENIDLVTMTTHGQPQTQEYFLGSVTRKILHNLPLPVLLVRPYWQKSLAQTRLSETLACLDEPFGKKFLANGVRLVLPLDMTEGAEAGLDLSFELAQRLDATLYLLKVNDQTAFSAIGAINNPKGVTSALTGLDLNKRNEANLYLKQIETLAEKNEVETVKIVLTGNPSAEIIAFGELMGPDALIMATHAFGDGAEAHHPSLTNEVMRRTHLPVFMVPITRPASRPVRDNPALARKS